MLFHARQRAVQPFRRLVDPLNKPESRARDFLQVERLPADDFVAVIQHRPSVFAGNDGDVLVAQETHRIDGEHSVAMNLVALQDLQKHNHVRSFGCQLSAGHVSDRDARHENGGLPFDAADVRRLEAQRVSVCEERQPLAEIQHQQAEQHQAHQDEQADFPFQSFLAHIKNAAPSDRRRHSQNDRPPGLSTEKFLPACR